jgi:thioredoxin reductase
MVFFPHTDALAPDQRKRLGARGIGVVEGIVRRLVVVDDRLSGVELEDGRVIRRAAVFIRPRFVPNNDVLTALDCAIDDRGWVVADAEGRTTVPGVWVAGNAANPRAQVITAAGEGSAVRARFLTALATGATLKQAVAAAGVSKTTGHYWLTQSGGWPRQRRARPPAAVVAGGT